MAVLAEPLLQNPNSISPNQVDITYCLNALKALFTQRTYLSAPEVRQIADGLLTLFDLIVPLITSAALGCRSAAIRLAQGKFLSNTAWGSSHRSVWSARPIQSTLR